MENISRIHNDMFELPFHEYCFNPHFNHDAGHCDAVPGTRSCCKGGNRRVDEPARGRVGRVRPCTNTSIPPPPQHTRARALVRNHRTTPSCTRHSSTVSMYPPRVRCCTCVCLPVPVVLFSLSLSLSLSRARAHSLSVCMCAGACVYVCATNCSNMQPIDLMQLYARAGTAFGRLVLLPAALQAQ